MARTMRLFARWHIWLGWLAGVPLLLWCASGLVMVAKPIEEVRGDHLRRELAAELLTGNPAPVVIEREVRGQVREIRSLMQNGRAVTLVTRMDGGVTRYYAITARELGPFTDVEARLLVAKAIVGGDKVAGVRLFGADDPAPDFRRPVAAWQVTLADGTHVYVGRDSGAIEAVRTRWWRIFDFVWGLHIMDLQTREDTHHPILILFASLALVSSVIGVTLLFRRRKARRRAA